MGIRTSRQAGSCQHSEQLLACNGLANRKYAQTNSGKLRHLAPGSNGRFVDYEVPDISFNEFRKSPKTSSADRNAEDPSDCSGHCHRQCAAESNSQRSTAERRASEMTAKRTEHSEAQ